MEITYTTFEDYLRNDLNDHDSKQLSKQLESNSDLNKAFNEYKLMRSALVNRFNIKSDEELLKHLEKYGDKYFIGRDNSPRQTNVKSMRWLIFSIAASLLFLVAMSIGLKFNYQDDYSTSSLALNSPVGVMNSVRGGDLSRESKTVSENHLAKLNSLYQTSSFGSLLEYYDESKLNSVDDIFAQAMLAESYLQLGQYQRSLEINEKIIAKASGDLLHIINYNIARTYILIGEKQKGMNLLTKMTQDRTNPMRSDADDLLQQYQSIKHWFASFGE